MKIFFSILAAITVYAFALILLAGCRNIDPAPQIDAIKGSIAVVIADIQRVLTDPALPANDQATLKDALTQAKTVDPNLVTVTNDFKNASEELAKVKSGWGYRLQVFCTFGFWGIVILIVVGIVLLIVFPALTPALMSAGGFIGGLVQHISAALPLQNIKLISASMQQKKIVVVPKPPPIVPGTVGPVEVTNVG